MEDSSRSYKFEAGIEMIGIEIGIEILPAWLSVAGLLSRMLRHLLETWY